jgi:hypothetical protein
MRRVLSFLLAISLFTAAAHSQAASTKDLSAQASNPLVGVWANGSRFVEFTPDGKMRFVLKTYYAFVYEDRDWMPYTVTPLMFDSDAPATAPAPSADGASSSAPGSSADPQSASPISSSAFVLSLRYPKEKHDAEVPLAVIGDAIYFRFYRKMDITAPAGSATGSAIQNQTDGVSEKPAMVAGGADSAVASASTPSPASPLDGFWIAAGNADALRLYRSDPVQEFFCYFFKGSDYYRIRYWATDARPKDVQAGFTGRNGEPLAVPKFIPIAGTLYTCVTSTGKVLRNYESGTFSGASDALTFKPSAVVFSGTAAAVRESLKYALSSDGTALALGAPYLVRSKVADLTAEIKAHNALRRPPRKPIFGFMKLDFHWDEIEKIRNNGVAP